MSVGVVLAGATLALLIYTATQSFQHECEVCVTFRGQTVCREAAGATRAETVRTATDNACSFIANGMTEIIECTTRTTPTRVTCND